MEHIDDGILDGHVDVEEFDDVAEELEEEGRGGGEGEEGEEEQQGGQGHGGGGEEGSSKPTGVGGCGSYIQDGTYRMLRGTR